jgi:hypothetical protein
VGWLASASACADIGAHVDSKAAKRTCKQGQASASDGSSVLVQGSLNGSARATSPRLAQGGVGSRFSPTHHQQLARRPKPNADGQVTSGAACNRQVARCHWHFPPRCASPALNALAVSHASSCRDCWFVYHCTRTTKAGTTLSLYNLSPQAHLGKSKSCIIPDASRHQPIQSTSSSASSTASSTTTSAYS